MNFISFYADGRAYRSGGTSEEDPDRLEEFLSQFIPEGGFIETPSFPYSAQFAYWKDGEILQRPASTVQISSDGIVTGLNGALETPVVYFSAIGDTEEQKADLTEDLDLKSLPIGNASGNTYRIDTWPEQDRYYFIA
jgi:hypothetical protein